MAGMEFFFFTLACMVLCFVFVMVIPLQWFSYPEKYLPSAKAFWVFHSAPTQGEDSE